MRANLFVRTGIATCLTAVASAAPTPSYAAALSMTLSSTTGPSGGGNPITATVASTGTLAFPAGTRPTVQFQYNGAGATACSGSAQDVTQIDGTATALTAGALTVDPEYVKRISNTKIAFTVPSSPYPADVNGSPSTVNTGGLALLAGQSTSKWNVCVYNSDSTTAGTLIGAATYTLAVRPTITSILPASGSALGGQSITVNGAGFTPGMTASIGGAALTDIQLAATGNSFTATTPAHVGGTGYALTVRTVGGLVTSMNPDNDDQSADPPILFTFDNSVSVAPDTAPAGSIVDLDIEGAGFDLLTFDPGAAPTDPTAHVFLVHDAYDPATNRGVQECAAVLVVDSSELVCTLDLSVDRLDPADSTPVTGMAVADGTYTVTVVASGSPGAPADSTNASIVASEATFTVAPH